MDGFLGQEISEQACHATDEFLGTCHSNRVSIDYEDLRESWSDEFQALARGVSDFDLATDSLDDTIFVPGPLGVDDGFAIMFNRLADVRGIGGTNASKILALHNSAGLAMWDIRNIRSLWGFKDTPTRSLATRRSPKKPSSGGSMRLNAASVCKTRTTRWPGLKKSRCPLSGGEV